MIKRILTILLLGALSINLAMANDSKVYKIAVDAAYPPFSFKKDKSFVGIELDLLEAIAKDQGFKYQLVFMNFDGVIPAIVSGQVDGALDGINISAQRQKIVDFSDPYFKSGLCVVVREDNNSINTLDDIANKKAAVKKGTYGMEFAEKNKDKYNLNLQYFTLTPDVVLAVKNKNADFFMEDYPVISYEIKVGAQKGLKIALKDIYGSPSYAFAVKKNTNAKLLQMFNQGLSNLKENGTYQKIIDKYI